jgi:surface carbohydrate biosynthesis protein
MKVFFLMVEVGARDSLNKAVLATQLLSLSDCIVIIGTQSQIRSFMARSQVIGVTLQNSCNSRFADEYSLLSRRGFSIATIDEESIYGINEPEHYLDERFDDITTEFVDAIFCASDYELRLLSVEKPLILSKVHVVGIPKFDFISKTLKRIFYPQVKKLFETYGDFSLYCSALGGANIHPINLTNGLEGYFQAHASDIVARRRKQIHVMHSEVMGFVSSILSEIELGGSKKLIIRPHPAEDWSPWQHLAQKNPMLIVVEPHDNIYPWLIAASNLIHFGCSTAIQYRALGKKPICLQPPYLANVTPSLANFMSTTCTSLNQLQHELNQDSLEVGSSMHFAQYTKRYINNIINHDCCRLMALVLNELSSNLTYSYSPSEVANSFNAIQSLDVQDVYSARTMKDYLDRGNFRNLLANLVAFQNMPYQIYLRNPSPGLYVISKNP